MCENLPPQNKIEVKTYEVSSRKSKYMTIDILRNLIQISILLPIVRKRNLTAFLKLILAINNDSILFKIGLKEKWVGSPKISLKKLD